MCDRQKDHNKKNNRERPAFTRRYLSVLIQISLLRYPPNHPFTSFIINSHDSKPSANMPAVEVSSVPATSGKEAAKSVTVLEDLMKTLSVSKTQDETNAAATSVASLLNGPTDDQILPSK